jgi:hypothetical protein
MAHWFKRLGLWLTLLLWLTPLALAQTMPSASEVVAAMIQAEIYQQMSGEVAEQIVFPPQETQRRGVSRFSQPVLLTPALISRNYQPTVSRGRDIAGRASYRLDLIPKHEITPRWTFWLDRETGVRLAYEQRSLNDELLASGEFLVVESIRPRISPREPGLPQLSPLRQRILVRLFENVPLPPGFVPVSLELSQVDNQPVLQVRIWDGLNGALLILYPQRLSSPPQNRYVRSVQLRASTLSVLSTLPSEAVDGWLEQVQQGNLGQLNRLALRRVFNALREAR